jgi:hypothetical protein
LYRLGDWEDSGGGAFNTSAILSFGREKNYSEFNIS